MVCVMFLVYDLKKLTNSSSVIFSQLLTLFNIPLNSSLFCSIDDNLF